MSKKGYDNGYVNGWMIGTITSSVLFLIAASLGIWSYMEYSREKTTVDSRIEVEKAKAKEEQHASDQKKFSDEMKNPRIEFVGPEEYGRVSFMYPKTWSVYIEKDGSDRGDYKAYLHPVSVPPTGGKDSRFAMRLEILDADHAKTLSQYDKLIKKGDLTSSSTEVNGIAATRVDGAFTKEIRGSIVLMRVRDKTIRFSTDAETFRADFDDILKTVKVVQ